MQIDQEIPVKVIDLEALTPEQVEELRRLAEEEKAAKQMAMDALGITLARSRSDAIGYRQSSGIENQWLEDEEHYEGIDEVNRGEFPGSRRRHPEAPAGDSDRNNVASSSTVFVNITAPYVDAAAAMFGDMVMATDDRAWSIKPTPIPDIEMMSEGKFPPQVLRQANAQFPGDAQGAQNALQQAVQQAMAEMKLAKEKADKAQKRIEDWHVQCQFHGEVRKVIEDVCKIGVGVLKGPVPVKMSQAAFMNGALVVKQEIQPASYRIDPWNFYPDPACGENIHNGTFCWERDDITERGLLNLIGVPGYFDDQINAVLEEGCIRATKEAPDRPLPEGITPEKKGMFEIWYFHGTLKREDMEAMGCECPEGEHVAVPVQVTMVNNRVIRAEMNIIDTGDLPYDVMVWQKKTGSWTGIGVSRKIRTPQEIVNGAARNLMDNAGRAGGPQVVISEGLVEPSDEVYEIKPWKIWLAKRDADPQNVDKAFRFVTIPMYQVELTNIIQLGLKLAEDATGLPLMMQGQHGSAPETLGGMQMLHNNATAGIRRVARTLDDRITEPHIRRYYKYLLQYGEDDEKGDFQIDARGSSSLVQRDIENQSIGEMAQMVINPVFKKDPAKWADEWLRSKHLDPERFNYEDEQWQQIVENMKKGPQDPRMAVAQLRAEVDMKLKQLELQAKAQENSLDREQEMTIAVIDAELAKEGLTADNQKVLSEIKARLSDTVIKIRAQREMQMQDHAMQITKPAVEPPGRAQAGKAFYQ